MKEKFTDETLTNAAILEIHQAIVKRGNKGPLNDLCGRESQLGAYVIFSGHMVSETVRISGAPASLVKWVQEAVMTHAMVCIEAQRQGHFELWRDLMGDPAPEEVDESKAVDKPQHDAEGENHGRTE
jgi:hypothetical protein